MLAGAVADATTCVFEYQELDPNVVASRVVADRTTHPFKRAQTDWLFILFRHDFLPMGPARSVSPRLIIRHPLPRGELPSQLG